MTTCPRCGRDADDEIVCADCGMSLALTQRMAAVAAAQASVPPPAGLLDEFGPEPETDEPERDVRMWRLAAIVCLTCVLAAVVAIVLLNQHGSPHRSNAGLPFTTAPGTSPGGASSSGSSAGESSRDASAQPSSPSVTKSSASPSKSKKTSAPASPVSDRSTSSPAGPTPTVQIARGASDPTCGRHCYRIVVQLSAFTAGSHRIACISSHGGQFGSYTTSSTTSSGCADRRPHDSAYVIVDGKYRSNTVSW
jgi:hypothetical protein